MIPYQPIFLALSNRARGGLVNVSSGQLGRLLFWAIPFAVTVYFLGNFNDPFAQGVNLLALIGAGFGGACLAKWGKYDGIPINWLMLTVQGFAFTGPMALFSFLISPWYAGAIFISGLMIAPCYWLGWQIPSKIKNFEQGQPLGELIFGFIIGLCEFLGFLLTNHH